MFYFDQVGCFLLSSLILLNLQPEELELLLHLLLDSFFLSEFFEVLVPICHTLLELFVKVLAHLVQLIPFSNHLLPLPLRSFVLAALLDQLLAQIALQKLQVALIRLLLLSL